MGGIKLRKGYTLPEHMPWLLMPDMEYELEVKHGGRKSFYGKAKIVFDLEARKVTLLSYGTPVAEFTLNPAVDADPIVRPLEAGDSRTTKRHIHEFIIQAPDLAELLRNKLTGSGCEPEKSLFEDS